MQETKIEALEEFIERFCLSLAKDLTSNFAPTEINSAVKTPLLIELHNSELQILSTVRDKLYTNLWQKKSPVFLNPCSLRESSPQPDVQSDTYYINVGFFLELYERRKSQGFNVAF